MSCLRHAATSFQLDSRGWFSNDGTKAATSTGRNLGSVGASADFLTGLGVYLYPNERILIVYLAIDSGQVSAGGSSLDEYAKFLQKEAVKNRYRSVTNMVTLDEAEYHNRWMDLQKARVGFASITDDSVDAVFDQIDAALKSA